MNSTKTAVKPAESINNSGRSGSEIRRQFIDFFKERHGHKEVASSPVVPHDDPTLLFANAGMNQFKDVFLATGSRQYSRAVDTQKCIRAGGKHNDLEDVGKDTYHHTFFEMLGNWSFGDYFKEEAIKWAWELLTDVWGLEKDRLHATIFGGDKADGTPADEQAAELWRTVTDISPENIHYGSKKDNFWEMGNTGPCGPCSEIHIDLTPDKSGASLVNGDSAQVIEIWNLVFIEFNRTSAGELVALPQKHVDTGMGFERLCAVLQGKTSNYDTDVFAPLFAAISKVTGTREYNTQWGGRPARHPYQDDPVDVAYRVIADHIRALTFALTDGAVPSNEGRGYVLRRILRRAVRHGRQTLGVKDPFLFKLVDAVVDHMKGAFPELEKNPGAVAALIQEEEQSFNQTLDRGIALFEQAAQVAIWYELPENNSPVMVGPRGGGAFVEGAPMFSENPSGPAYTTGNNTDGTLREVEIPLDGEGQRQFINEHELAGQVELPGKDAFTLYDTYGFPVDLTQVMAEERNMSVDMEGFNRRMEEARELSRNGGQNSGDIKQLLTETVQQNDLPKTEFTGYHQLDLTNHKSALQLFDLSEGKCAPVDSASAGQRVAAVVDTTPFYAEMGGQVGDRGVIDVAGIDGSAASLKIEDTLQVGGVVFHIGQVTSGQIASSSSGVEPATMTLCVSATYRARTEANHTSTHMLNRALRKFVNPQADQRGSLVDEHKLRFDFSNNSAVTIKQLQQVQQQVNDDIAADMAVNTAVADQEKARQISGLRAVFGEKYPPKVRVVSIGAKVDDLLANPDNEKWAGLSIEFCGGTHLQNTGAARRFVITHEENVAKGIRRITALTGAAAQQATSEGEKILAQLNKLLEGKHNDSTQLSQQVADLSSGVHEAVLPVAASHEIREGIAKLQDQLKKLEKQKQAQSQNAATGRAKQLADGASGVVIVENLGEMDASGLRAAMDVFKSKHSDSAILLAGSGHDKVALTAVVPKVLIEKGLKAGAWIKQTAQIVGGGGGGRDDKAQAGGKDPKKLDEALQAAREFAKAYG